VIALRHGSNIVERYEYDPYGNVRIFKGYDSAEGHEDLTVISDSIAGNPFLFAGYFHDNETGLYHVRHRMYSPQLARWLQRDPAGYADGMNLYEYARNNPIRHTDPAGHVAQGTQPANDRSKVCCKYKRTITVTSHLEIVGTYLADFYKFQQTESNTGKWKDPRRACQCASSYTVRIGQDLKKVTTVLDKATWGRCCWCRVYHVRTPNAILGHSYFWVECDDGKAMSGTFCYEDMVCGVTIGQYVKCRQVGRQFALGEIEDQKRKGNIVRMSQIDCECFKKVFEACKQDENEPPDYNVIQDCAWWVEKMMNYAKRTCYGRG